jgi:hypothetical protein
MDADAWMPASFSRLHVLVPLTPDDDAEHET